MAIRSTAPQRLTLLARHLRIADTGTSRIVRFTTHVRDFRVLYAICGGWAVLLFTLSSATHGHHDATDAMASQAPTTAAVAPTPTAAPPAPAATPPDQLVAAASVTEPAPVPDAPAVDPATTDSAPPSSTPATAPACSADSALPTPVATTIVGSLATTQSSLARSTGQPPPVDAARAAGSAAGCSASASPSTASLLWVTDLLGAAGW